jgi:hypothetical protein
MFRVPWELYDEFLRICAEDMDNNHALFISEDRTPIFRFFVDIDLYDGEPTHFRTTSAILIGVLHRAVLEFFPEHPMDELYVVVCGAQPRDCGSETYKCGLHLVWPNLFVDSNMALRIRETILARLYTQCGKRTGPRQNDWCDVIDEAVYLTSGLRIIGTHKMEKCTNKECPHAKQRLMLMSLYRQREQGHGSADLERRIQECKEMDIPSICPKCHGKGRIDVGRVYKVYTVIGYDTTVLSTLQDTLMENRYLALKETCIRTPEKNPSPTYTVPLGAPACSLVEERVQRRKNHSGVRIIGSPNNLVEVAAVDTYWFLPRIGQNTVLDADERAIQTMMRKKEYLDVNSSLVERLTYCVQGYKEDIYKDLCIVEVFRNEKRTKYVIRVGGPNANYCLNLKDPKSPGCGAYHSRNNIFFEVTRRGIAQRCFSRNFRISAPGTRTTHRNGSCKDFRGPLIPLPAPLHAQLFPNTRLPQMHQEGDLRGRADIIYEAITQQWEYCRNVEDGSRLQNVSQRLRKDFQEAFVLMMHLREQIFLQTASEETPPLQQYCAVMDMDDDFSKRQVDAWKRSFADQQSSSSRAVERHVGRERRGRTHRRFPTTAKDRKKMNKNPFNRKITLHVGGLLLSTQSNSHRTLPPTLYSVPPSERSPEDANLVIVPFISES